MNQNVCQVANLLINFINIYFRVSGNIALYTNNHISKILFQSSKIIPPENAGNYTPVLAKTQLSDRSKSNIFYLYETSERG